VARALRETTSTRTLGLQDDTTDLRISIAGAQEKTALLHHNGEWYLPRGSTPTTHIFKLPLGLIGGMKLDLRDSIENEWLCALILRAFGLPVAACQPRQFEDVKALVVERFDRAWWTSPAGDIRLIRLPQEDMCQATGTPPSLKYEADGGPGMDRIMVSVNPAAFFRRAFRSGEFLPSSIEHGRPGNGQGGNGALASA